MAAEDADLRCRVLVTRPLGDAADRFCAAVEAAGFEARSLPLMALNPVTPLSSAQRQRVFDLDHYQHVIFISSNAVRFGMAQIEACWPQLPDGLHWYAIGSATAAALAGYGIAAITPGQAMHSEGLLAVPGLQRVEEQRVLIVKGYGGRDTLRQELTRRGARVDELACYRRSVPELSPGELYARVLDWRIDCILLSSGEGLSNLLLLLSQPETSKLKHMGLIVPSDRVAEMARNAGFDRVVTAENASDEAMLRALCAWQSGTGE